MSGLFLLLAETGNPGEVAAWQWWATGAGVLGVFGALLGVSYGTRTGIIARATTKEAIRQPLFALMLFIGVLLIVVNTFLPFFSFGQDVKMLKDCGLATILITGLLLAVWTASTSIASEIEGKTAMTLLSKPITRPQFVLGKYIGILQGVIFLLAPLIIVMCLAIFYKVGYDAKESGKEVPAALEAGTMLPNLERSAEVLQILPGFALIFLEIAVLAAVSTAISTRMPMVVNMVSTFAIFVVGHLTTKLVESGVLQIEIVYFMAQLIATVLPNLDYYNVSAAVATGATIPPVYLLAMLGYTVAYGTAAILLSFILFEDRDLA
ncbi:MAG: ABC transporter permease [Planctomycetota bacterium]|nr:ABC transporter permease [Planctomycetota bacterium]MDA1250376.1 ABC transporter permease [Planctomycetota bacterium]